MDLFGKVFNTVVEFYKDLNPSTLSGAIDVVVVEQPDGSLRCSPFYVRFGKMHLLRPQEKVVEITVNGKVVNFPMKVGEGGEAFFVIETNNPVPHDLETSPLTLPISDVTLAKNMSLLNLNAERSSLSRKPSNLKQMTVNQIMTVSNVSGIDDKSNSKSILLSDAEDVASGFVSPTSFKESDDAEASEGKQYFEMEKSIVENKSEAFTDIQYPFSDTELELGTSPPPTNWNNPNSNSVGGAPLSDSELDYSNISSMAPIQRWKLHWENLPVSSNDNRLSGRQPIVNTVLNEQLSSTPLSSSAWEMSLCGPEICAENANELFEKNIVTFEVFSSIPEILEDPRLIFRFQKQNYYTWQFVAPLFVSQSLFHKSPSPESLHSALEHSNEKHRQSSFTESWRKWWTQGSTEQTVLEPPAPPQNKGLNQFKSPKKYAKTLRLTSDQLKSLSLKYGANDICFTVNSSFSGKASCNARIFYWKNDVSIVVSDIDGTITKSDALGHLFNLVGKDWTHPGIANLYTNIHRNGYEFLFLTSRAIGQADWTRMYLRGVEQDGFVLPVGPVILSPDRLIAALKREVIDRRPEEFKIAALTDIRRLFGDRNPFYAGFGNRITDAISYRAVEIPAYRIYSIDPNGNVKMDFFYGYNSSYVKLTDLVDHIFPHLRDRILLLDNHSLQKEHQRERSNTVYSRMSDKDSTANENAEEAYNDYHFWKPVIQLPDILEQEKDTHGYSTDYEPEEE